MGVAEEDMARLWDRSSRLGGCRDARGDRGAGLSSGAEGAWVVFESTSLDPHLPKLTWWVSSVSPSDLPSAGMSSGWLGDGEQERVLEVICAQGYPSALLTRGFGSKKIY